MGKDFSHSSFSLRVFLCMVWALALVAAGFAQNIPFNSNVFQDPIAPGDPLHRHLETEIAVDPFASHRLFTVAIDYRNANTTGEAWCSWAFSRNGGRTWENKLFKGDPLDPTGAGHPLFGLQTCGDPVAAGGMVPVSGLDPQGNYRYVGKYFAGGLAFTRGGGAKEKVFVTTLSAPADGSAPSEERTVVVDEGTPSDTGGVLDKPTILFVPPGMPGTSMNGGHGVVHFCYSVFDGKKASGRPTTKIMCTRSLDGGITFSSPVKVNNNEKFGNGTAMAVDTKGILYLIWTDHASPYLNASDIYLVRSSDGGQTWSQATKLPAANLFDQPQLSGNGAASRLPAFASIAIAASPVGQPDKVIVAYQAFVDGNGNQASPINSGNPVPGVSPRAVVTVSLDNGNTFLTPKAAAWDRWDAYQFFPKLVSGGNWVYLLLMDGRNILPCTAGGTNCFSRTLDFVPQFGGSFMTGIDRKMHARILQADLANWTPTNQNPNPPWNPSRRVSQYLMNPGTGKIVDRDALHPGIPADDLMNPPNFSGGRTFIGDYNGLVSAVQFKRKTGNVFRLASEPGDLDARTVNAVFVSTQHIDFPNVGLPNQSNWQVNANWWDYNPALCINIGTRKTAVIYAPITPGVVARWSGTSGQIQGAGNPQQEFILHVENTSQRDRFFQIRIIDRPGDEDWSFYQKNDRDQNTIQTQILRKSSTSRSVYRHIASLSSSFVDIEVKEITAIDGPAGSIESTDNPPQNVPPLETTLSYRVGPEVTPTAVDLHKVTSLTQPVRNLPVASSKKLLPSSVVQYETTQFETVQYETTQYETTQFETTQFETAQFETTQYETTQYETAQLSGDKDFTLTLKNEGAIATAVNATTTVLNGQGLLTGPTLGLDPNGYDFQLLLYRTYKIPVANACTYNTPNPNPTGYRMLDLVISNVTVNRPNEAVAFKNHQVANEKFENTQFETTQFETTQFETLPVSDAQLSNPSAPVDSGETIYYTVRSYKPAGQNGYNPSNPATVAAVTLPQQVNPGQDSTADPTTRVPIGSVLDATGPVITRSVNPAPNLAGWNNSIPVTVTFDVNDPGSGIKSKSAGCNPAQFTQDTTGTQVTCTATNGGNTESSPVSVTVKIDTVRPDTTITAGPNGTAIGTNSTSFSFNGTDATSGVSSFECKLDGGSFASCTSPQNLSALAEGLHTFSVQATDAAGNVDASPDIRTFTVDTKPPVVTLTIPAPDGMAGYFVTSPVTVTVSATDAASNVSSFSCNNISPIVVGSLSGIGTPAASGSFNLTTEGVHNLICTATDSAGNNGNDGGSNTGTVKMDTVKPDTTILTGPANGSTITSNSPSFTFTGSDAAPSSGGPTLECKLDGASFASCTSPQNLSGLAEGSHTFSVRATDTAGNVDASPDSRTFKVDTRPPVVTLNIPAPNGLNGFFKTSPVSVPVLATDATSNVSSFACTDNGSPVAVGSLSGIGTSAASGSLSVSGEGLHNLICNATDSVGNLGNDGGSNSGALKIDTKPPVVTISSIPAPNGLASYFVTSPVTVPVSATDAASNVGSFTCTDNGSQIAVGSLSGIGTSSASGSLSVSAQGTHNLICNATDFAGNLGNNGGSNTRTVKIDSVKPDTTILTGPANGSEIHSSSTSFTFSGTDAAPSSGALTFECKLDAGSWAACTSPKNLNGLSETSHTFSVRAKDPAGNVDDTPATRTFKVDD